MDNLKTDLPAIEPGDDARVDAAPIRGRKSSSGGGKGGGSAQSAPDTLYSNATVRLVDLLGEGEIVGVVGGLKGIYFNKVPVQNADGSFNFRGITADFRSGTPDQPYMAGYPDVETPRDVGVKVNQATPVTATIADGEADRGRVILEFPALFLAKSDGSVRQNSVSFRIEARYSGGPWVNQLGDLTLTGKNSSPYFQSYEIDLPRNPAGSAPPWNVRVTRLSPDTDGFNSSQDKWTSQSDIVFHSLTSIQDAKFSYPHSALVGLTADASQFGSSVPARTYLADGEIIKVPSNYDPVARTYSGIWDGTFKEAWTDNPAWIFYDLLWNDRYGLGEFLGEEAIDKWTLYQIGAYSDVLVEDGKGGREPRFRFNAQISQRSEAFDLLQQISAIWRGMAYWSSGSVTGTQDRPDDVRQLVTPANVVDGVITYSSSARKARHTVALVTWNDPDNLYEPQIEAVELPDGVARYGYNPTKIDLLGCTSRGQAHREGLWRLLTENYATQTATYRAGLDHAVRRPGDLVAIADPSISNIDVGGRLAAGSTALRLALDRPITLKSGQAYEISVAMPDGTVSVRDITTAAGLNLTQVDVAPALLAVPDPAAIWQLAGDIVPQQFRIIGLREVEPHIYEVQALQHEPAIYAAVDDGAAFEPLRISELPNIVLAPTNLMVRESTYFENGVPRQSLLLSWTAGQPFNSAAYYVTAVRPNGSLVTLPKTSSTSVEFLDAATGDWTFVVQAEGLGGRLSEAVTLAYTVDGWAGVAGPGITGLQVVGGGTVFSGRSASLEWQITWPAQVTPYAAASVVRVFDPDSNVILHTETVAGTRWTYGYDVNVNEGGPRRRLRVAVSARSVAGQESVPASITISNPAPAMVVPTVAWTTESIAATWDNPGDPDLAGALVWLSKVKGFNPLTTAPAADVTATVAFLPAETETDYYVRVALYDAFSKDPAGLNISPEIKVRTTNRLIDTVGPDQPTGLTLTTAAEVSASGVATASITATWNPVASTNLAQYQFELAEGDGTAALTSWMRNPTAKGVNTFTWRGLKPGQLYAARVRGINGSGYDGAYSTISTITSAKNTAKPGAITGFTVTANYRAAALSWTNPGNLDLDFVEVWEGTATTQTALIARVAAPAAFYFDNALATLATRTYWVRPVNTSGTAGDFAGPQSATLPQIGAAALANSIIDATKIAASLAVPQNVTSLPATAGTGLVVLNGELYRWQNGAWTKAVAAPDITGFVTSAQIQNLEAAKVAGQLTNAQLASIDAAKLVGQVLNAQIATLDAAKIAGQLTDAQILGIAATKIAGQLSSAQIADLAAAKITGQVVSAQLADNAITQAKLAADLSAVGIMGALPSPTGWTGPKLLLVDGRVWRLVNGAWTAGVGAADITGTITAGQIQSLTAAQIAGTLTDAQLAGISAAKVSGDLVNATLASARLSGQLSASQIASVNATAVAGTLSDAQLAGISAAKVAGDLVNATLATSKLSGQLTAAQIAAVNATAVAGTLTDAQLAGISAAKVAGDLVNATLASSKLSGQLTAAQIASVNAAAVAGTLSDAQLAGISAAKLIGQVVNAQIASLDASKLAGQVAAAQIAAVNASAVTGTLTAAQIGAVNAAVITGQIADTQLAAGITAAKVYGSLANASLAAAALTGQITASQIASLAAAQITGQIVSTQITDSAVSTAKLAAGAVVAGSIAAGAITTSKLAIVSQNIAYNPDLSQGSRGWSQEGVMPGLQPMATDTVWTPTGMTAVRLYSTAIASQIPANAYADLVTRVVDVNGTVSAYPASPGVTYEFSAALSPHRCTGRVAVAWLNSSGTIISYADNATLVTATAQNNQTSYRGFAKTTMIATAPAGAVRMTVFFRMDRVTGDTPFLFVSATMIAATTSTATETSPYAVPGATVIDGATIVTGSMHANRLTANSITSNEISAASIVGDRIAGATITGANIAGATITAGNLVAGTITATEIAASTITAAQIAAGTITTSQIAAGTILAGNIAAGTITGDRLAANTITATQVLARSLTALQLAAGTITATEIAASTITGGLIAGDTITGIHIKARTVSAANLVANTITSNEISAASITGDRIAGSTVTGGNIAGRTITAGNLVAGTITATEIAGATITGGLIAGDTITGIHIKARTVSAANIVAGTLTANEISAASITGDRIAGSTITGANIAGRTITAGNLVAGTITAAEIAGSTITGGQIAGDTITGIHVKARTISAGNIVVGTLTSNEISAASITGDRIAGSTITGGNIAGRTITAGNLLAGTITATEIAGATITGGLIAANTITGANLSAGTITAREIAANSVTTNKLTVANREINITGVNLRYRAEDRRIMWDAGTIFYRADDNTMKTVAIPASSFIVAGDRWYSIVWYKGKAGIDWSDNVNYAADSGDANWVTLATYDNGATLVVNYGPTLIDGGAIITNSITAAQIKVGTLTGDRIAAGTIDASRIIAGTIQGGHIAGRTISAGNLIAGTITAAEIATRTLTADRFVSGTITANELGANSVTAGKIDAGAITAREIAAGSIVTSKLSITTGNIAQNGDMSSGVQCFASNGTSIGGGVIDIGVEESFVATGMRGLRSHCTGGAGTNGYWDTVHRRVDSNGNASFFPCNAGQIYEFSCYWSAHRCQFEMYVAWFRSDNTLIGFSGYIGSEFIKSGGAMRDYPRATIIATAPAGAAGFNVLYRGGSVFGNDPYIFPFAMMYAAAAPGAAECSPYIPPSITTLDGSTITTGTLNANKIVSRSIYAGLLQANTITAAEIAGSTITGDKIAANTITAGNLVAGAITAREIAAASITTNLLTIANRELNFVGFNFRYVVSTRRIEWDAGTIYYRDDDNGMKGINIPSGSFDTGGNYYTLLWYRGRGNLDWNGDLNTGSGDKNWVTLGTYSGGSSFYANYGSTLLDGDRILTNTLHANRVIAGTITADKIATNTITAAQIQAGAIGVAQLAAGAITADKIGVGLNSTNLVFNSDFMMGSGATGPWTSEANFNFAAANGYVGINAAGPTWQPPGMRTLQMSCGGQFNGGSYVDAILKWPAIDGGWTNSIPVVAGKRYELSGYLSAHRCEGQLYVQVFDPAGGTVAYFAPSAVADYASNGPLAAWARPATFFTMPATAATARVFLRMQGNGGSSPFAFWTGIYFGQAQPNQTAFSDWAPGSYTVITGAGISARTITADRIIAGSITATEIAGGTITGDRIAANTVTGTNIAANSIYADKIQIGGGQSLTTWMGGTNNTQINGGMISANSIRTNTLQIGMRGLTITGLNLRYVVATRRIEWDGATIFYLDDNGSPAASNVPGGSFQVSGSDGYSVNWYKGRGNLDWSTDYLVAMRDPNWVTLATYDNGTGLAVNYGSTIIDGARIVTGSITATQIAAGTIQANNIAAGTLTATQIAVGTIVADRIAFRTITGDRMVAGTVGAAEIAANSITASHIAASSITADKIEASTLAAKIGTFDNLIVRAAQIGSLVVGNANLQNNAATQLVASNNPNGKTTSVTLYVRAGAKVRISGQRIGDPSSLFPLSTNTGALRIRRDGADILAVPANYMLSWNSQANASNKVLLGHYVSVIDNPGEGTHTYEVNDDSSVAVNGVYVEVTELAK